MSEAIVITDQAAAKVWEIIREEANPELKLRIYIEGGGCSGLKYNFTLDEQKEDDDFQIDKTTASGDTIQVLINAVSYPYLAGAQIDYKNDLEGERFVISNPQAKTTCGCGSSFTLAEEQSEENKDDHK